jgi:hypothetical protein
MANRESRASEEIKCTVSADKEIRDKIRCGAAQDGSIKIQLQRVIDDEPLSFNSVSKKFARTPDIASCSFATRASNETSHDEDEDEDGEDRVQKDIDTATAAHQEEDHTDFSENEATEDSTTASSDRNSNQKDTTQKKRKNKKNAKV